MQLEVKDLSFSYDEKKLAVNQVSFSLEKGSYNTIIGHNGSGKSTIAKLLIGLLERKSGTVTIDDVLLTAENVYEVRDKIGIVFQNPDNQFIGSTVRDDIAFGLENHSVEPSKMDDIITRFATLVGMSDYLEHEPTKLSGGQKQRVAIAGVLAMSPEIIIMDESTSMLDPKGKKEVNDLVMNLHRQEKMTILSITHDIEEVILSDQVIVMNEGEVVMQGLPEVILRQRDRLVELGLDVPFSVKVADALKGHGLKVKNDMDLEGMVNEICQYVSNT